MKTARRTPKAPQGKLVIVLSAGPNPDFDPGWERGLSVRPELRVVSSIKEASKASQAFIRDNDLGGGNWTGGSVYDDKGDQVARISYNGRAWEPGRSPTEIKMASSPLIIDYFEGGQSPNPMRGWESNVGMNRSKSAVQYFKDMKVALKAASGLTWRLQRNTKDVPAQAIWGANPTKKMVVQTIIDGKHPPTYFSVQLHGNNDYFNRPIEVVFEMGLEKLGFRHQYENTFKLEAQKMSPANFGAEVASQLKKALSSLSTPLDWDKIYDDTKKRLPKKLVPMEHRMASNSRVAELAAQWLRQGHRDGSQDR